LIETKNIKYVFADATGPMARYFSRNYRHFLWIGNVILIIDDVRAYEEGVFQWLLHYEGEATCKDKEIVIENNDSKIIVRNIFPKEIFIEKVEGLKDHDPDTKATYFSFNTASKGREAKYITALVLLDKNNKIPKISPIEYNEIIGVSIVQGNLITYAYFNERADGRRMHQNSNNNVFGWETDAYILLLTKEKTQVDKDFNHCSIVYGSYLRKGDKIIFDSLSKAFVDFKVDKSCMEIHIEGQDVMRAKFSSEIKPVRVTVNGKIVNFKYDGKKGFVEIVN